MCDREVGQPRGYQPLVMWFLQVAVVLLAVRDMWQQQADTKDETSNTSPSTDCPDESSCDGLAEDDSLCWLLLTMLLYASLLFEVWHV